MFATVCPRCGADGTLDVVQATFVGRIPLCADGFAFSDAVASATEHEVVACTACAARFPLADVTR
jgi:uncharacterized protein YbaR (Trm112 family)